MDFTLSGKDDESLFLVRWNNSEGGLSEGPLSLLWNLIESYKIDIFDVSLSKITEDFINFVKFSESLSIELGAEFSLTAANLIYLKSKALLPNPGFEEENYEPPLPKELVAKLLEHKKYQMAAGNLSELEKINSGVFKRETNQILMNFGDDENWLDVSLLDLISSFNKILEKNSVNNETPDFLIASQEYSVDEKIDYLQGLLKIKGEFLFFEMFESDEPNLNEIVVSFLALLELVKLKTVKVTQHKMFGDIKIIRNLTTEIQ
ncbi:MAG: segregation/condensation protein A [Leptospiraceae bacterium]|nr:segregation/condensation protein A [Leptospiraceae bacterium]MCK6380996.1 segregation/condensation protein A [Leptospiraceae bacterium]NUM40251.1 segregation/condensation protein A [Leptospiraceae bacterium]